MSKYNRKLAMLLVLSGCAMQLSCDKFFRNVWIGFGEGVGLIPANIFSELIVVPILNSLGVTTG